MLPLFDDPSHPPASPPPFALRLAPRLARLAAENIFIGTSSWKYEGWLGQIYTPERYQVRGRFSERKFATECLTEYARTFPAVCGDFSFYQFPSEAFWRRLFASAPPHLLFAFKAPEEITVKRWPGHARYGARGGASNASFLNAALLREAFLAPLAPFQPRIGTIIFEFGAFPRGAFDTEPPFVEQLTGFLKQLPGGFRYAVEVRNPELLGPEYFGVLRAHGAAHVFNAWTRMPRLGVQIALNDAWTAEFTVVRALLSFGRRYEDAVKQFAPYRQVQAPDPHTRQAIRQVIARARRQRQLAFIFVNNRLEGNAPETIAAIVGDD